MRFGKFHLQRHEFLEAKCEIRHFARPAGIQNATRLQNLSTLKDDTVHPNIRHAGIHHDALAKFTIDHIVKAARRDRRIAGVQVA